MTKILWIPGWASDFRLWQAQIEQALPAAEHSYLGYPAVLDAAGLANVLSAGWDAVVAWSLGTLQLGRALAQAEPGIAGALGRVILHSPVGHFCDASGWPEQSVELMITHLGEDERARAGVLQRFVRSMGRPLPRQEQRLVSQAWLEQAAGYSPSQLVQGLRILQTQRLPIMDAKLLAQTFLIWSADDAVVPAAQVRTVVLPQFFGTPQQIEIDASAAQGHWPHFDSIFTLLQK